VHFYGRNALKVCKFQLGSSNSFRDKRGLKFTLGAVRPMHIPGGKNSSQKSGLDPL